MKRFIISGLCLAACLMTGCSKEEAIESNLDFSSPYVLADDPGDPIAHRRYEIYQKYQVAVFLNDTVSKTQAGKNLDGTPRYQYETIDMNWGFSSHNKSSVTYIYDYIKGQEAQNNALDFVEFFLAHSNKKMHPFSILMVDTLKIQDSKGTRDTTEFSGFRTLILAGSDPMDEAAKEERSNVVLRKLVKWKVSLNETLVNEFGAVSKKNNYYGRAWVADLGCVPDTLFSGLVWGASRLYNYELTDLGIWDFRSWMNKRGYPGYSYTVDRFVYDRKRVFTQIGKFGFICGNRNNRSQEEFRLSPANANDDMDYFIDQILSLGEEEFTNRYGQSPLVMQKFTLLVNYIKDELGITL